MNKTFEEILSRLEDLKLPFPDNCYCGTTNDLIEEAKKVVQKVAEENNNGWIPCSERMPKEYDSIFARFKGTDKWNDSMYEKISDTVNVTIIDKYSNTVTTHAHTVDGKWRCDLLRLNNTYSIIAWQPLPEPYHPKEANDGA